MSSKVFSENISHESKPVVSQVKYLFNPKRASLLSTSTKPRPPEIYSDSLLISWGLLSGKLKNQNIISTKLSASYQIFVMIFVWLNLIKFIIGLSLDENSNYLYIMGDFSVAFIPMMKRIFIQIFYLFCSLKASIITTYFCYYHYFVSGKKKFSWLNVLQLTEG